MRAAEERSRAAEARVPQLEAAAKQAHARAVAEATARELLQARAEASERRVGRLVELNAASVSHDHRRALPARPLRSSVSARPLLSVRPLAFKHLTDAPCGTGGGDLSRARRC